MSKNQKCGETLKWLFLRGGITKLIYALQFESFVYLTMSTFFCVKIMFRNLDTSIRLIRQSGILRCPMPIILDIKTLKCL